MNQRRKILAIGGSVLAIGAGATGAALAAGGDQSGPDDGDGQAIAGSALDQASAVALDETGGGKVTDSERDDEEGFYEIEVTKSDGSQVDVHLDRDFNVLDAHSDGGADD